MAGDVLLTQEVVEALTAVANGRILELNLIAEPNKLRGCR